MKIFLILNTIIFILVLKNPTMGQTHYRYVLTHNENLRNHDKKVKHIHDSETPDPKEEARELKRMQRHARIERGNDVINRDKENIDYEKRRWKTDHYSRIGSYTDISKAGLKQHKRKLKEDKGRI